MSETLWSICQKRYFLISSRIRCEATRAQYRFALNNLAAFVGHEPTPEDLSDDAVSGMMGLLARQGLAPKTINERRGRINAIWSWLAKRGEVKTWPTVGPMTEPERAPLAWQRDELSAILAECDVEGGRIAGIPARLWWTSLHYVMWDSSERIGALMGACWPMLTADYLTLPAEIRKGRQMDRVYHLHPETLSLLESIKQPVRQLIWPWDRHPSLLWSRYKRILKRAGLTFDRKSMFHRMRKSVASHYQAAGGDASALLGHQDARSTRAYIDSRIAPAPQAIDRLFRPG